ncbi:hypothetical protein BXZ70DRAFT_1078620 [Cristinia sonorae]|uniref:Uncharacterized protein n=1 Tax=Cristinia sonorae TaxID=1940300 RepID=A0A8K0UKI6_9AGAR|nr:hypothetical protein BXZ70DRAFT_1078620 [Cristinia sonorae]
MVATIYRSHIVIIPGKVHFELNAAPRTLTWTVQEMDGSSERLDTFTAASVNNRAQRQPPDSALDISFPPWTSVPHQTLSRTPIIPLLPISHHLYHLPLTSITMLTRTNAIRRRAPATTVPPNPFFPIPSPSSLYLKRNVVSLEDARTRSEIVYRSVSHLSASSTPVRHSYPAPESIVHMLGFKLVTREAAGMSPGIKWADLRTSTVCACADQDPGRLGPGPYGVESGEWMGWDAEASEDARWSSASYLVLRTGGSSCLRTNVVVLVSLVGRDLRWRRVALAYTYLGIWGTSHHLGFGAYPSCSVRHIPHMASWHIIPTIIWVRGVHHDIIRVLGDDSTSSSLTQVGIRGKMDNLKGVTMPVRFDYVISTFSDI